MALFMPVHFANGLFDQPWLVAIFIIVGLISNWLMKRRQEQEAARPSKGEESSSPAKPEEEFDLETAMRRLLGEPPPAQSAPPPPAIPGAQRPPPLSDARQSDAGALRPGQTWQEEEEETPEGWTADGEELRPTRPPVRLSSGSQPAIGASVAKEAQAQPARRLVPLESPTSQRPTFAAHESKPPTASVTRRTQWRNPQSARQAFVASLVFGPPKSMES